MFAANAFQPNAFQSGTDAPGGVYVLDVDTMAITIGAQNALFGYILGVDSQGYIIDGQAAGFAFPASPAAMVIAAQDALWGYSLGISTASYIIAGQDVADGAGGGSSSSTTTTYLAMRAIRMISTTTASFTRPADTNPYLAGELVANSTTAGSVTPLTFTSSKLTSGRFIVRRARLYKSSTTTTAAIFNLHLFSASPTVTGGDNATFGVSTSANYLGTIALDMSTGSFAGTADLMKVAAPSPEINVDLTHIKLSERRIFGLLATGTGGTYTPASGETFSVTLELASAE